MSAQRPAQSPAVPNGNQSNGGVAISLPSEFVEAVAVRVAELLADRQRVVAEPWIGVEEAAAHLACGRSRLYALTSANRIPHRKDGSRVLFRVSELDAWLSAGGGIRP